MHNVLTPTSIGTHLTRSSLVLLPVLLLFKDVKSLPLDQEQGLLGHLEYPEYDSRELIDDSYEELYPESPAKRAWASNFSGGMGKRAWNSQFSGGIDLDSEIGSRPRRGWQDLSRGNWGKRSWKELSRGNWGKRNWQELSRGNWGKRNWQELSRGNWGKRNWQELSRGNWGKRSWRDFSNDLSSKAFGRFLWRDLTRGNWGKRDLGYDDLDDENSKRYAENEALYYNKPEEVENIEDMDTVLEDLDNNDPSPDKADHVFKDSSNSREDDKDDSENQDIEGGSLSSKDLLDQQTSNNNQKIKSRTNEPNRQKIIIPIKQASKLMADPETGIQTYQADDGTFIVTYDNNDLYDDGKTPQDNSFHKFGERNILNEEPKNEKSKNKEKNSSKAVKDMLTNSWNKRTTTWMQLRGIWGKRSGDQIPHQTYTMVPHLGNVRKIPFLDK